MKVADRKCSRGKSDFLAAIKLLPIVASWNSISFDCRSPISSFPRFFKPQHNRDAGNPPLSVSTGNSTLFVA